MHIYQSVFNEKALIGLEMVSTSDYEIFANLRWSQTGEGRSATLFVKFTLNLRETNSVKLR